MFNLAKKICFLSLIGGKPIPCLKNGCMAWIKSSPHGSCVIATSFSWFGHKSELEANCLGYEINNDPGIDAQ